MESSQITINIKLSAEKTFSLQIESSKTVLDLKKLSFEQTQAKPEELKIIFKGKILKDTDVLSNNKIENLSTVHLVIVKQQEITDQQKQQNEPQQQSQPNNQQNPLFGMEGFGGMSGMGGMGGMPDLGAMGGMGGLNPAMFQGPQFQQMLQSVMSNPQMIQNMISSNPMLQQMVSNNPMLQQAMNDPATLQMLSNPAVIQQAMQMAQQGGAGAGAGAGGMGGMGGFGGQGGQMPDFQGLLNNFQNVQNQPQVNANQPPEQRFKDQLQIMSDMGFSNKQANIDALVATNGNVEAAVERLLNMLG